VRSLSSVGSQAEVRAALAADEFRLDYQPIVDLMTGQPAGVEALLRWQHPRGGLLSPDDFLPAVEHSPVIVELTRWVLTTACAAATRWPGWHVSVNISARDLLGATLLESVDEALKTSSLDPARLTLEVTETALVQDVEHAAQTLRILREGGVAVALDDFGTGYSSMLYLRDLPVSEVKIDRAFISGLEREGDDLAIVTTLLTLSRAIGLNVVAEGVETAEQAQILSTLGCAFGQGYWWSRPQSSDAIDVVYRDGLPAPVHVPRSSGVVARLPSDLRLAEQAASMLRQGASLHTIAAALNAAGERTAQGTRWHAVTVARLLSRQ
jgi:EAL domain-containing protein (putative c-di-GMP-specific phosphodiesterase class I)